jgi:hypothetical protein
VMTSTRQNAMPDNIIASSAPLMGSLRTTIVQA